MWQWLSHHTFLSMIQRAGTHLEACTVEVKTQCLENGRIYNRILLSVKEFGQSWRQRRWKDGAFANRKECVNIISCSRGIKATLIFHNFKRLVLNLFLTN